MSVQILRQSTAVTVKLGPFVDATDGVTEETGLTISQADVRLSKNGGNIAQKNEATSATHDELGYYDVDLDATDTGTLGRLRVAVHESGALPVWRDFLVVPAVTYDALVAGTDYLTVDMLQLGGDTQSATDLKDFADAGYDPATNKVQGVVTVDTTTTNTDMRGTDNAALAAKLEAYVQLLARSDAAIATDRATELAEINANEGSGAGDYDNAADSVEAIRDRGDAGWITATGFSTHDDPDPNGYIDAAISSRSDFDESADQVTVATNNDKTGYSLSATGVQAIWDALTSALTTVGSIGKRLADNIDAAISSRSSHSAADVWNEIAVTRGTQATVMTGGGGPYQTLLTDLSVQDDNWYANNLLVFTSGGNSGVPQVVRSSTTLLTNTELTLHPGLPTVGAENDAFILVPLFVDADYSTHAAADVADAVWDEARADHAVAGTFGEGVKAESLNTQAKADVNAEVDIALSDYDPPTKSEMDIAIDALPTAAEIDTELTSSHGSGAWTSGSAGGGANTVTVTASDGAGTLANNVKITAQDGDGNTVGVLTTDSLGVCEFKLDDGDYTLSTSTTSMWESSSNDVTVSGDTDVALTLTPQATPSVAEGDYCRVHVYAREENGDIPSGGTFSVDRVISPDTTGSGTSTVTIVLGDNSDALDNEGHAYLDILQGAKVDLSLTTHGRKTPINKRGVTIPAESAKSWEDLT